MRRAWGRLSCPAPHEPMSPAWAVARALRGSLHLDSGGRCAHRVWCRCGGADAEAAQKLLQQRKQRDAARAAKVDRAAMFGGINDWRDGNNPDKMILEAAGAHTFYSDTLEKLEPSKR